MIQDTSYPTFLSLLSKTHPAYKGMRKEQLLEKFSSRVVKTSCDPLTGRLWKFCDVESLIIQLDHQDEKENKVSSDPLFHDMSKSQLRARLQECGVQLSVQRQKLSLDRLRTMSRVVDAERREYVERMLLHLGSLRLGRQQG